MWMKGDKLVIQERHIKAAHNITELLLPQIVKARGKFIIAIAGESGSGKSEIAAAIFELLPEKGIRSIILQQDDYFVYPPRTNDKMRREDIRHVGLSEVRLDMLDQNLHDIIVGKDEIEKPLVIFDEDRITKEVVKLEGVKTIIVDGTYTTILKNQVTYINSKVCIRVPPDITPLISPISCITFILCCCYNWFITCSKSAQRSKYHMLSAGSIFGIIYLSSKDFTKLEIYCIVCGKYCTI